MTTGVANIVGLCGSVLFIIAFSYANRAKQMNKVLFNGLNLIGAFLLLSSLWVNFNLPAFALEVCWALIAFSGLISALRDRGGQA
jgi:hypothetical protein